MEQDPFTWITLQTIAGGALACTIVPNVLGMIFLLPKPARAGIALAVGLAIQLAAASQVEAKETPELWLVAVLNGFLVAATALGINQTGTAAVGGPPGLEASAVEAGVRRFFSSWL